ncbi:ferredoxin [Pseudovirgaria hyperparasitica]|uniref:Ferredoxin n=1 Tax=Pseudovirgaria hyperparasitica TaxID=470096 RepID=A0A6A6VWY0_9PEZI|nr:ferredoxin [Pseudovirgaria hyperparasitica]KAF2754675.1 ferredoxin [Pseudovirgaria hyperparasitica]
MSLLSPSAQRLLVSSSRALRLPCSQRASTLCSRQYNSNAGRHSIRALSLERSVLLRQESWRLGSSQQARTRRRFSTSLISRHGHLDPPKPGEERRVTFIDKELEEHTFAVADGDNLLDIAQANDIEMEGACGGSCACSTCHVIVEGDEFYDKMDEPDDDENDMLDLAFGLTETSRLGCQVKMSKDLDGMRVKLPSMTRNLQASDFEEKKR